MTRVLTVPSRMARANIGGSSKVQSVAVIIETLWKEVRYRDAHGIGDGLLDAHRRGHQGGTNRLMGNSKLTGQGPQA